MRRVVESVLASRALETIVVLGHAADLVAREITGLPARAVLNPDYATGMASSLRAGLAAVSPDAEAALILLGDQPLVTSDVIGRLIAAFETSGKPIVAPLYNGVQGNPVCFARALFPELSALTGDRGAKLVVERDAGRVAEVAFETDLPLLDLDVEDDYDALRRHFS
jgi:molybdenum cofactor cytidylyltransferase